MSVDRTPSPNMYEASTARRVRVLAVALVVTAVATVPGGLLWPEPSTGDETYAYADIASVRELWWWVLLGLATVAPVATVTQAIATMVLVRDRGSAWATWGGALMWLGIVMQSAGAAFLAGAYFFPTSPDVDRAAGTAVIEGIAQDQTHLFAVLIAGALTAVVGTVLQAVGLFRARVVPAWVPIATLFAVLTFLVPGNGLLGLVTSIPMAAGAIALAVHAWQTASPA